MAGIPAPVLSAKSQPAINPPTKYHFAGLAKGSSRRNRPNPLDEETVGLVLSDMAKAVAAKPSGGNGFRLQPCGRDSYFP
jgi:hypothetical protein